MSNANGSTAAPKQRATRPAVSTTRRQQGDKHVDFAESKPWGDVQDAAQHEELIRAAADAIWAEHGNPNMTRGLFMRLYPLLREPIHPGHIIATSRASGKPYESDGVRSVQVQIDRMNNVLTPMWWTVDHEYETGGTECLVTVRVFDMSGRPLAKGESWGGVDRASTRGNLRKGSFTNAGKLAFARVGPAHEFYTHAIDYDPDVNPEAAHDQTDTEHAPSVEDNEHQRVRKLLDLLDISHSWNVDANRIRAMLTACGVADTDDMEKAIAGLSAQQARVFDPMLTEAVQAAVAAGKNGVGS